MNTRWNWRLVSIFISLLIVAVVAVVMVRQRQAQRLRAEREARYAAVVENYGRRMPRGLTREEVERQLQAEGTQFFHICCMGAFHNAFDTLVKIGEESAPFYCSELSVHVGFEFVSEGTHQFPEARGSDTLTGVRLFEQLTGCL